MNRLKPSFPEAYASVRVPQGKGTWRKFTAYMGPGLLIAVGYMDPGNWATDLAGGARFGYLLLSVILLSNLMAMLLQHLSLKLGVVTGRDLAQSCRDRYSSPVNLALWLICEIAIIACDLAEVIGSAIALQLLFGLPLVTGVLITALDVVLLLLLPSRRFRWVEIFVGSLLLVIGGCFVYELSLARPAWTEVLRGLVPHSSIITDPSVLYIAIGILGATVMPHNLYLHSSIAQTRDYPRTPAGRKQALRFGTWDSNLALSGAFFVNAAILILSAAVFHGTVNQNVADISDAYHLLSPILGSPWAGVVFAVALLAAGQNSTLTGTLAGQIVMEGFLDIRLKPWLRRLITRGLAIVPAAWVAIFWGERGVGELLILSQVVLSLQLSFAVIPLVVFTSDKKLMGEFVNRRWLKVTAIIVSTIIAVLNLYLVYEWLVAGA